MGRFTLIEKPGIDRLIEAELGVVVSAIDQCLPRSARSILLVGGFGRGEGSIASDGLRHRPLNDYDLLIAIWRPMKESHARTELASIAHDVKEYVSVKQVDLNCVGAWKLKIPWPTVERYESKHGYQLLQGTRPMIAGWPRRLLPLCEGTQYLRNRAFGLLIARLLLEGYGPWETERQEELAYLEVNKAFLAVGDAWLIGERQYHFKYARRLEAINSGHAGKSLTLEGRAKYVAAASAKLNGRTCDGSLHSTADLWTEAAGMIHAEFLRFESMRLSQRFDTLEGYWNWLARRFQEPKVSRSWFPGMRSNVDSLRTAQVTFAGFSLLRALSQMPIHAESRSHGHRIAQQLRDAKRFLDSWHPEGIVAELSPPVHIKNQRQGKKAVARNQ